MNLKKSLLVMVFTIAAFTVLNSAMAQQAVQSGTALASAARTAATVSSTDRTNTGWRGILLYFNTSVYVSGTYTLKLQGKDPISGAYVDLLVGDAVDAAAMQTSYFYPGLPATWRVQLIGASTPSATNSVSFSLLP